MFRISRQKHRRVFGREVKSDFCLHFHMCCSKGLARIYSIKSTYKLKHIQEMNEQFSFKKTQQRGQAERHRPPEAAQQPRRRVPPGDARGGADRVLPGQLRGDGRGAKWDSPDGRNNFEYFFFQYCVVSGWGREESGGKTVPDVLRWGGKNCIGNSKYEIQNMSMLTPGRLR